jgi:Na+-translocating ferredoxin:NAD+ oxidoreductase RnfD subunit
MTRADLLRRRRCRVLLAAMAIGVFLPVLQPSWITVAAAVVGITVLALLYGRECRDGSGTNSNQGGAHPRGSPR